MTLPRLRYWCLLGHKILEYGFNKSVATIIYRLLLQFPLANMNTQAKQTIVVLTSWLGKNAGLTCIPGVMTLDETGIKLSEEESGKDQLMVQIYEISVSPVILLCWCCC